MAVILPPQAACKQFYNPHISFDMLTANLIMIRLNMIPGVILAKDNIPDGWSTRHDHELVQSPMKLRHTVIELVRVALVRILTALKAGAEP